MGAAGRAARGACFLTDLRGGELGLSCTPTADVSAAWVSAELTEDSKGMLSSGTTFSGAATLVTGAAALVAGAAKGAATAAFAGTGSWLWRARTKAPSNSATDNKLATDSKGFGTLSQPELAARVVASPATASR